MPASCSFLETHQAFGHLHRGYAVSSLAIIARVPGRERIPRQLFINYKWLEARDTAVSLVS